MKEQHRQDAAKTAAAKGERSGNTKQQGQGQQGSAAGGANTPGAEQQQQQQQQEGQPGCESGIGTNTPGAQQQQQQQQGQGQGEHGEEEEASPFACITSTMGWSTFHMVLTCWLSQVDVPAKSDLKDWDLLVGVRLVDDLRLESSGIPRVFWNLSIWN